MYSKNQIYNLGFNIGHLSYNFLNTNLKGFNGMESDDEVKGTKNSYTTEFRMYDPRLGRWLSLDPMMNKFASKTPFGSFSNNPIIYIDPKGDADYYNTKGFWVGTDGKNDQRILVVKNGKLKRDIIKSSKEGMNYTLAVERGKKVFEIPTGTVKGEVIKSIEDTRNSKKENGGHYFEGDTKVTRWDEGPGVVLIKDNQGNVTGAMAMIFPMVVNGVGTTLIGNVGEDLKFWWHTHPDKTFTYENDFEPGEQSIYLGVSTPSGPDKKFQKKMENVGFKGNTFVIGVGDETVTYYNSKGELHTFSLYEFLNVGTKKEGKVYDEFQENKQNKSNSGN